MASLSAYYKRWETIANECDDEGLPGGSRAAGADGSCASGSDKKPPTLSPDEVKQLQFGLGTPLSEEQFREHRRRNNGSTQVFR